MATKQTSSRYDRRYDLTPTDEVILAELDGKSMTFPDLFAAIHEKLKAVYKANTGEETMRLRSYERVQWLLVKGRLDKTGKSYTKRQHA